MSARILLFHPPVYLPTILTMFIFRFTTPVISRLLKVFLFEMLCLKIRLLCLFIFTDANEVKRPSTASVSDPVEIDSGQRIQVRENILLCCLLG